MPHSTLLLAVLSRRRVLGLSTSMPSPWFPFAVLARSSVVVSAGNGGYPSLIEASGKTQAHYTDMSITDPGNADLAITVGSTHRDMPHTYGVSYFSSRGPTGDGRLKPAVG